MEFRRVLFRSQRGARVAQERSLAALGMTSALGILRFATWQPCGSGHGRSHSNAVGIPAQPGRAGIARTGKTPALIDFLDRRDLAAPDQPGHAAHVGDAHRSEEHTSELQSLMRISYDVFRSKK